MRIIQNVLFITNKLNLLIWKFTLKFSRNKIISCTQFKQNKINNNRDKTVEDKSIKEKSVYNVDVDKIMRTNNVFSINMLMFCDKENENKSLKLSHFKKLKDTKSLSTFLYSNPYFNA